jgi:4-amino-4-deoxy-L-arabinose transferase-like glycosyltransferase
LFYVPVLLLGTLPWSAFLWKALKEGSNERTSLFEPAEKHLLLIWIFSFLIFFSISSSKLIPYIAPVFLPIAMMVGHVFRSYEDRNIRFGKGAAKRFLYDLPIILQSFLFIVALILPSFVRYLKPGKDWSDIHFEAGWFLIILPILFQVMMMFLPALVKRRCGRGWFLTSYTLSVLFFISMLFPMAHFLTSHKSAYPVSKAIRALLPQNRELFQFRISLYGIDFYNKIRTPMIDPSGELEFGFNQLCSEERRRYHLSHEDFDQRRKEGGGIYCVTRYRNVKELKITVPTLEVLWDNGEFYLVRLPG